MKSQCSDVWWLQAAHLFSQSLFLHYPQCYPHPRLIHHYPHSILNVTCRLKKETSFKKRAHKKAQPCRSQSWPADLPLCRNNMIPLSPVGSSLEEGAQPGDQCLGQLTTPTHFLRPVGSAQLSICTTLPTLKSCLKSGMG